MGLTGGMESETDAAHSGGNVRSRMMELLYASGGVTFSVRQLATILGVKEASVQREAAVNDFVVYDTREQTVELRHRGTTAKDDSATTGKVNEDDSPVFVGSDSAAALHATRRFGGLLRTRQVDDQAYSSGGGGGGERRGAAAVPPLRRRGAARSKPYMRSTLEEKRQVVVFPAGQVGRVGYVCVADEFNLGGLEVHYRSLGYFTRFDFDVLHVRFADEEMNAGQATGGGAAGGTAEGTSWNYGATERAEGVLSPRTATAEGETGSARERRAVGEAAAGRPASPRIAGTSDGAGKDRHLRSSSTAVAAVQRTGFDLFIFEYGAVVWWGFDQRYFKIVENDFMLPDTAISRYMTNRYTTKLVNENYPVWCTYNLIKKERLEADEDFKRRLRFDHFLIPYGQDDVNTCSVSMLCASHALAQSAKIDYLEIKVQELTESCSPLPRDLKEKGGVNISERRLLQLRGEVLSYRLMLKSGSDLLDEPDLFWENAYLKPVFQATKEGFEISERVEALDNKLDAANEILSILADEFSQRHGARLEWIVIWLVFVEVIIGVLELLVDSRPWLARR